MAFRIEDLSKLEQRNVLEPIGTVDLKWNLDSLIRDMNDWADEKAGEAGELRESERSLGTGGRDAQIDGADAKRAVQPIRGKISDAKPAHERSEIEKALSQGGSVTRNVDRIDRDSERPSTAASKPDFDRVIRKARNERDSVRRDLDHPPREPV